MYSSIFMSYYTVFYWLAIFGLRVCRSNTAHRRRPPSNSVVHRSSPLSKSSSVRLFRAAADGAQLTARGVNAPAFNPGSTFYRSSPPADRRAASGSPRGEPLAARSQNATLGGGTGGLFPTPKFELGDGGAYITSILQKNIQANCHII